MLFRTHQERLERLGLQERPRIGGLSSIRILLQFVTISCHKYIANQSRLCYNRSLKMFTSVENFIKKYPKFSAFVAGNLGAVSLYAALHFGLIKVL